MLSSKDVALVYENLLTSPSMNDAVRITLRIPRKNVLLLSKVLEAGLSVKDANGQGGPLTTVGNESLEELKAVSTDLLKKSRIDRDLRQAQFIA